MIELEPFRIAIDDAVLDDLRDRLRRTRWPGEVAGGGWTYGTDLAYLRELVDYWLNGYDWRAAEAQLNEWPQFRTTIDGIPIHFAHVRGRGDNPLPLIVTHGWPGSFFEFVDIAGPLADPAVHGGSAEDAFDLVMPSLPGYGFSPDPGRILTPAEIADLWARLMDGLGYTRFGAQGGDWGATVTTALGHRYPDRVAGIHLNMLAARPYVGPGDPPLTDAERAMFTQARTWQADGAGYQQIQGTRPQTLAYGLTDSPAGLCAWIIEKFRSWSDSGGDIEKSFTKDQLLTNVMIYWVTGSIGSSCRMYHPAKGSPWLVRLGPGERVTVPTGLALFPAEIIASPPRSWVERAYAIERWTTMPTGGHFAALEEPALLVEDMRGFFRPIRAATYPTPT